MCVYVFECVSSLVYVCLYDCRLLCVCVHMCARMYACMCVCTFVYTCFCEYASRRVLVRLFVFVVVVVYIRSCITFIPLLILNLKLLMYFLVCQVEVFQKGSFSTL